MKVLLVGASGWLGRSTGPLLLRKGVIDAHDLHCMTRSGDPGPTYNEWPAVRRFSNFTEAIADCDVVILSIRPDAFRGGEFRCEDRLVISFMAGVGLDELALHCGSQRIARAMPNAAVEIGCSYTPWIASSTTPAADEDRVRLLLSALGTEDQLFDESHIDTLTAISGSGHAYPALLAKALTDVAVSRGLPEHVALRAAMGVVRDAAQLLGGEHNLPGEVVQQFLDYNGTTAAALRAANQAGFEGAIQKAVDAGASSARESSGRSRKD